MKIRKCCGMVLIAPALLACNQREPEQIAPAQVVAESVIARNAAAVRPALDTAMFAGGCFWSMERPFERVPGVIATTVGYAGGSDYRTIIFTRNSAQRSVVENSRMALERSAHFKTPIVTEIVANARFWRGEEYHQHFADRNPDRYDAYKRGCGRDARLHELWGNAAAPYVPKD